jgi:integrase
LIGGTEATGHEAEAKFAKKTQKHQIRPTFARPGTRQGRGVEQPELSRRKEGLYHAIDEFVDWYCSEPRLAFNRIVVLRYRSHLESRQLAPVTINLRLGAVRRLAYEAADRGLLSADLAAGIRRVKGVKKMGIRLGNWLTAEQGHSLWQAPDRQRLKGKRDRALLALLLACGLRRHEAVTLTLDHLQQRIGPLLIWLAREVTFERFRFPSAVMQLAEADNHDHIFAAA